MRVLLLEDSVHLSEIITLKLEKKNYIVDLYENGKDALDNFDNAYDCFILDVKVPKLDGITLLRKIKKVCQNTPVIMMSSSIDLDIIKEAYMSGCADFLKKPFYMYELEHKVDLLCKKDSCFKLLENYEYDMNEEFLYDENQKPIKLSKKEQRFMTLLLKNKNRTACLETIEQYVWEEEGATLMSIRSLVKRLKLKLPEGSIVAQNYGYAIVTEEVMEKTS